MADWELTDIRDRFRTLTGRPDTGQISDDDIDSYINDFYQNKLPKMAGMESMTWFYTLTTSDGTGDYGLENEMIAPETPIKLYDSDEDDWYNIDFYRDYDLFWSEYEFDQDASSEARPVAALIYKRTLYLRPTPDSTDYTLYLPCLGMPQALSDDTDTPERPHWGLCLAYGAAAQYLADQGEIEDNPSVLQGLNVEITMISREYILQSASQRAIPRW
jgi:hypothetical protein